MNQPKDPRTTGVSEIKLWQVGRGWAFLSVWIFRITVFRGCTPPTPPCVIAVSTPIFPLAFSWRCRCCSQLAAPTLACNPLYTYHLAFEEKREFSKMLLRPAGGVVAWQIHTGTLDARHGQYSAKGSCAIMLHAFNMVGDRIPSASFVQRAADWGWVLPPSGGTAGGAEEKGGWVERCIPAEARAAFNSSWEAEFAGQHKAGTKALWGSQWD